MRSVAGNTWEASDKSLLTICRALIRSILDYGSCAFDSAHKSAKDILDRIQAKVLRISCAAMTSTSISALLVEWGEFPLNLRRKQQMVKYAIKVKASVNHPARSVIQDDWTNHYDKFTQHTHKHFITRSHHSSINTTTFAHMNS